MSNNVKTKSYSNKLETHDHFCVKLMKQSCEMENYPVLLYFAVKCGDKDERHDSSQEAKPS